MLLASRRWGQRGRCCVGSGVGGNVGSGVAADSGAVLVGSGVAVGSVLGSVGRGSQSAPLGVVSAVGPGAGLLGGRGCGGADQGRVLAGASPAVDPCHVLAGSAKRVTESLAPAVQAAVAGVCGVARVAGCADQLLGAVLVDGPGKASLPSASR